MNAGNQSFPDVINKVAQHNTVGEWCRQIIW